ncbi:hypothetical protein MC885_015742 [Smutsia gigantea]|nr:hypothetical protein MC885_015742 [Smutsia gigantea]
MNSSDEEQQLQLITSLKEQAIGEYENLRAENQKTKEKHDKISPVQKQIKELRDHIVFVQEEKKMLAIELENLKSKLVKALEEVNKVKQEKDALYSEVLEQRKILEKCNRVSKLAVEDYEEMQSSAPDQQLLKPLDETAKLIQLLKEERIQHQQKVKELKEQLENETLHKEIHNLKQQLELLEDKKELELKYQNSEEKARNVKHSVDELQKRVNQSENSVPPPPPPPPPLPPPPRNPNRSLMSMIQKRSTPAAVVLRKKRQLNWKQLKKSQI